MDKRKYGRFKMGKEDFVEIPRFDAEDDVELIAKITMSISGWAYEHGKDAGKVMNTVGFVIQNASKDFHPNHFNEIGRKLVEGDEKDHA